MKHYVIYVTATGQILQSGSCADNDIEHFVMEEGRTLLETPEHVDPNDYILAGTPANKPVRPSDNHVFDYGSKSWVDPRTLAEVKAIKWKEIKQARNTAEFRGFTWDSSVFDSDAASQSRIQGASQLATLATMNAQPFSIDWTLADNTVRTLDANDMIAVGQSMGVHVNSVHSYARLLRTNINTAATVEDVEAITWQYSGS